MGLFDNYKNRDELHRRYLLKWWTFFVDSMDIDFTNLFL